MPWCVINTYNLFLKEARVGGLFFLTKTILELWALIQRNQSTLSCYSYSSWTSGCLVVAWLRYVTPPAPLQRWWAVTSITRLTTRPASFFFAIDSSAAQKTLQLKSVFLKKSRAPSRVQIIAWPTDCSFICHIIARIYQHIKHNTPLKSHIKIYITKFLT